MGSGMSHLLTTRLSVSHIATEDPQLCVTGFLRFCPVSKVFSALDKVDE